MTDGVATEGEIERDNILENLDEAARSNTRIFTFGVGDDVDTFLLDSIVQAHHGTVSYVRPSERIDEEVASLYNKISAPVLTDTKLDFDAARVELLYPAQLPDLFAGEQLTLVGRYRDGVDNATLRLSGEVNGESTMYVYDGLDFRDNAGGEAFIARLWATRRIGDLLNTIRLNGENSELVDSVVDLSVRYGIITPYTSFLIEEDDILTQSGRDRAASEFAEGEAQALNENVVGSVAVDAADAINDLNLAQAPALQATSGFYDTDEEGIILAPVDDGSGVGGEVGGFRTDGRNALNTINSKTFVNINNVWTDTTFDPDNMTTNSVAFLSDEYFDLLDEIPEIADYFAQGDNVIVVIDGVAYEVVPE
jgi:Ca-activated chloride channel family protein